MWGVHSFDVGIGDGGLQPYLFLHSARLPDEDWLEHACVHWGQKQTLAFGFRTSAFTSAIEIEGAHQMLWNWPRNATKIHDGRTAIPTCPRNTITGRAQPPKKASIRTWLPSSGQDR
jgi:hypothetical protein